MLSWAPSACDAAPDGGVDVDIPEDIVRRYPAVRGNALAMARLCAFLRQKELHDDALALGMAAIRHAPHDMMIRDIVRKSLSTGVPAYHWRMLQDGPRNAIYARALERTVRAGMTVLEIGTGAGLLALMAARAGARVITCESNPMIAAAAREIARSNGLADRITVISKRSDMIELGTDLPEPADLLVHEIFGDALFNEGVIPALADARQRLAKPDAVILPRSAELRIALVACAGAAEPAPGASEGFDLTPFDLLKKPISRRFGAAASGVQRRSDASSVLATCFERGALSEHRSETVMLGAHGGRIDAVAQWIRIDFGEGEILENDPFGSYSSHWKASLFDLAQPIDTRAGDQIEVTCCGEGTTVRMNALLRQSVA